MRELVLVTGGAGFIGSHLADGLAARGRAVRILDDLSTGRRQNVEALLSRYPDRIDFIQGDVRDAATVSDAVEGVVAVSHQAALPSVERSVRDPWTTHQVNADGTLILLEACRRAGVERFVLAGSSSVYGDQPELPKRESMAAAPRSPYALSKLVAEQYARLYAELYGMGTVTLRYFNVFGPRQDPESPYAAVIPLFIRALAEGRSPTIYGDGNQTRDFTYVANVVEANLKALDGPRLGGQALNVACGERISLLALLDHLGRLMGREPKPVFAPPREGDVRDSQADVSLARQLLGFAPTIGFEDGIRLTVQASDEAQK
ncbi:MAG: SDR family oxidoreductase [Candidatus Eisenbacteria bacterium]|nr:SDR family oxidoreductase [Candidatus Eisenbacteria bacterium]